MLKKILVPFDGSGASVRALAQAIALARLTGGSIEVVFAHEEAVTYGEIAVYVQQPRMAELQRAHADKILAEAEEAGLKASGVPYAMEVAVGAVAQAITTHADRSGCDAIVMGRHGHSMVRDLLMGSVAMKVLHRAKLPVLLVP